MAQLEVLGKRPIVSLSLTVKPPKMEKVILGDLNGRAGNATGVLKIICTFEENGKPNCNSRRLT